ncbi:MAG: metal ABC transporter ATP-binding protein [Armatimonadetes bacterium]|nr:metal ABC transporter ATP-binding protein [Armatimonadota bacterium]
MKKTSEKNTEAFHNSAELLSFDNVDLGYARRVVLSNLSLRVAKGDFLAIVGPNGAGKTTILKAMLGILRPIRGEVRRAGDVRFGYVPQSKRIDDVYPLTALEVALMGRYTKMGVFSRPSRLDREFVLECMRQVGISELADRQYRELSGGQKQRTLIARALAAEPTVLALDEPTADMDLAGEHTIMELLERLHQLEGITVVIVSHLLNVVVNYAKTLAIINGGLRTIGRTEDVISSRNLSEVYGIPVTVSMCGDKRTVLAGDHNA